jgi:hypothetical protein
MMNIIKGLLSLRKFNMIRKTSQKTKYVKVSAIITLEALENIRNGDESFNDIDWDIEKVN